MGGTAESLWGW